MNKWQLMVMQFPDAIQSPSFNRNVEIVDKDIAIQLIKEETTELLNAIQVEDLTETVDGACDAIYVILWAMNHFGIDLESFFAEVHRTNLMKAEGPILEGGKRGKPKGWKPPRIATMIEFLKQNRFVSCQCRNLKAAVPGEPEIEHDKEGGFRCEVCHGYVFYTDKDAEQYL